LTWPSPENYRFCPVCAGPLAERLLKPGEPKRLVCTRCGFIFYIDPKLAVLSVVPYQGGVVLVRRAIEPGYGLWVAPGGFVDVGEKVEEAVVRNRRCGYSDRMKSPGGKSPSAPPRRPCKSI